MEILISIVALVAAVIAIGQVAALRRENSEVLKELKALRNGVDAFEATARGESSETVVDIANQTSASDPAAASAPKTDAKMAACAETAIPAHILAIIAASVAATLRGEYRIRAIRSAETVTISVPIIDWSLEGRRQIYSSHKLR